MQAKILQWLVGFLVSSLTVDQLRKLTDKLLDWVEDEVASSDNTFDDALLPLVALIRQAFNIPDND